MAVLSVPRSLPQLRRLGDAERRRWYRAAKKGNPRRVASAWVQALVGGGLAGLVAVIPGALTVLKAGMISMNREESAEVRTLLTVGWMLVLAAGALALFVARHLYAGVLRRLLRTIIDEGRCPSCRYSLAGLDPGAGAVRCPECGRSTPVLAPGDERPGDRFRPS